MLNEHILEMHQERFQRRPLSRQSKTLSGYEFTHKIPNENLEQFQQIYRLYLNVFLKLCSILRKRTPLQNTRFIRVEEMVAIFLLTVGQNSRYCLVRKAFGW